MKENRPMLIAPLLESPPPEPTESSAMVLKLALDIKMVQIRGLEFDRIKHRHLAVVARIIAR